MERYITYVVILLIVGGGFLIFLTCEYSNKTRSNQSTETNDVSVTVDSVRSIEMQNVHEDTEDDSSMLFNIPLSQFSERQIKKPFGIYITQQNSPIMPERFQGFHTGVDFEVFQNELGEDVDVRAICDGSIRVRQSIDGYGGVVVQECMINGEDVTVLYGHVDLDSVQNGLNDDIAYGDIIGLLGSHNSFQTDGERKHLHLSIYRGKEVDVRGYVSKKNELNLWIDPCDILTCAK